MSLCGRVNSTIRWPRLGRTLFTMATIFVNTSHLRYRAILILLLSIFMSGGVGGTQLGPIKHHLTTSCLTEVRDGRKSCWGIVIRFEDARFKRHVRPNELKLFEAKHGANLLELMTWHTSSDRKQLTIKFKTGTGDFGTGNPAEITLFKTAFASPPKDFPKYMVIVQRTDID